MTIGAIITSVSKGATILLPQLNFCTGVNVVAGLYSHFSRHVMPPPLEAPASAAQSGGRGRQRPVRSTPLTHAASAPASATPPSVDVPSASSQYWPLPHSLES